MGEHAQAINSPGPLPPLDSFWSTLDDVFGWLAGTRPSQNLARAQFGNLDPDWTAPRAITTWRRGFPLELLRYAGANRLRVEIAYRPGPGRSGSRIVQPYSLRRTSEGHIVLFVINDRRQLRSYRIDRIAAIKPTNQTFTAIRRVEFQPAVTTIPLRNACPDQSCSRPVPSNPQDIEVVAVQGHRTRSCRD